MAQENYVEGCSMQSPPLLEPNGFRFWKALFETYVKAKVTAIEEAKDLAILPLDELIGNLKVYKMVLDNDRVGSKTTKEKVTSLGLKAKIIREQTSDDSDSQGGSDKDMDEEEAEAFNLLSRNFCKFFRKVNQFRSENRFSIMVIGSVEAVVCLKCDLLPDDWIVDSSCTKHMTRNKRLFTSYKAYDGGHVVFGSNLKGKVVGGGNITHDSITITNVEHVSGLAFNLISVVYLTKFDPKSYEGVFLGYSQTSKAYIVLNKETTRIKESLNVTFDESFLEPKSSPLVEDDRINEPIVQDLNGSPSLQVNVSNEGYPKSLKEAKGHPID
ncbi:integrase, catalytic region, zinc finger, CCHC-type containing protein [Tanacetum coccineum]|uniref:Integrase, catalytic region, zinc finger, CCHC-type containing protein n=1 Tax=Tanacetum coccineum TaxID=301880 RepID=A0ABQ5DR51_9ASTR